MPAALITAGRWVRTITCGREADASAVACVWGSELFVRTELGQLLIKP